MAAGLGYNLQFGIGTSSTVDGWVEILSEQLALQETLTDTGGFRGTRQHAQARVRSTQKMSSGPVVCSPIPAELDLILPWLSGGTKSVNTIALGETLTSRYVTIDRHTKVYTYAGVYVNKATFSCAVGQPLQVTLDLLGGDETVGNAGSFPALTKLYGAPYIMSDCVVSVGGTGYSFEQFEFTLDNKLEQKFFNSVTPTRTQPTDLEIAFALQFPLGDAVAVYGATNTAVIATFTNGNYSFVITASHVDSPKLSPTVGQGRGEILLPWTGIGRRDASDASVVFTNDSTA